MSIKKTFNLIVILLLVSGISMVSTSKVFAMDKCLSGPWDGPEDYCEASVKITPASGTIPSGSSVMINVYAFTQFQWGYGGWQDVDVLIGGLPLNYGPQYVGAGGNRNVTSGVLTNSVSLNMWGINEQGVQDSDSSFITVTPAPPTVNLFFSFLDSLKTTTSKIISMTTDYFSVNAVFAGK